MDDICMLCCTDCLRTAIRLPRGADAIILAYAPDVSGEVKVKAIFLRKSRALIISKETYHEGFGG